MKYDVIIIGAGASGLMAAIAAARQGSSVLVIERKDKAGKKILATGNGKCNFTNMLQDPECYRSNDSSFAMKVLSCFDVHRTLDFFLELGIYPKNRDGYIYPNSEQALSVVQVLMMECERLKVTFGYNEKVIDIKKPDYTVVTEIEPNEKEKKKNSGNNAGYSNPLNRAENSTAKAKSSMVRTENFTARAKSSEAGVENTTAVKNQQTYFCSKLILATGGCASPQLGSDGSGYSLAKHFGHTIIKPLPALVQLKSPVKYCKTVSGVRTTATITAFSEQEKLNRQADSLAVTQIAKEQGEILFTDYGISGIPIMQISRFVAKEIDGGAKVHLQLDFFPEQSGAQLLDILKQRTLQNPNKNFEEMMAGLFNNKLIYILLNEAGLDVYKNSGQISRQELNALVQKIKEFRMPVSETNSFENAQVTAGGVATKEINEANMESKLSKNLYLVGELVDVDGTCGGYNLQWAWSSGYLAGTAAGKK